jgi:ubiquinone biosynthesis protein UbiJ
MIRPDFSLPPLHALAAGAALRALNRLLDDAQWARALLAPHAGRVVALETPLLPGAAFEITGEGRLALAEPGRAAEARLRLVPGLLPGSPWSVDGEADLAATLRILAEHLRWDGEDALARWIGDIPAKRAADAVRGLHAWQQDTARRVLESATGYVARERGELLHGTALREFGSRIAALGAAINALEERVARLQDRGRTDG